MRLNKFNNKGVTLIELTVALAIFSVVIVIAVDSFMSVFRTSRDSIYNQNLQDHAEFLFSMMSKEIRMAKINYDGTCDSFFYGKPINGSQVVGLNQIYATSTINLDGTNTTDLRFKNYKNECVRYYLEKDPDNNNVTRLKVDRQNPAGTATESYWVSPIVMDIQTINFTATPFKFDEPVNISNAPYSQLPSYVYYTMKIKSNLWNPDTITYTNFIVGRNFEQF